MIEEAVRRSADKCQKTQSLLVEAGVSNMKIAQMPVGVETPKLLLGLAWCLPLEIQNLAFVYPRSTWSERQSIRIGYARVWATNFRSAYGNPSIEPFEKNLDLFDSFETEARNLANCFGAEFDSDEIMRRYYERYYCSRFIKHDKHRQLLCLVVTNSFDKVRHINSKVGW